MFNTRITQLFGIEHPIIQGAMQWLSRAELVAAVSNAGGLGILASLSFATAEELRQEIRKTRRLTSKPFAINITVLPSLRAINHEEFLRVAIEEGVGIIETAGRSPEPFMPLLKSAGVKAMHKVARVKDAKTAERLGVDAVTIVGFEAGGHPSMDDVASLVLIPMTADAVEIPVIAGGGIAEARGLVAALALGAEGVVMGTRFMASQECPLHPNIKQWLLQANETDTIEIERSIKNAARVMKTDLSLKVLEMEGKGVTLKELEPFISGQRGKQAMAEGNVNDGIIHCGQSVGLIHEIPTVKQIIDGIINQAREVVGRLDNLSQ
ncbi:MAG: nitronate monooxygenase [Chloroflexi bacterium]|nr:nitronate monooxygenase [Chloroflexota bacterium]